MSPLLTSFEIFGSLICISFWLVALARVGKIIDPKNRQLIVGAALGIMALILIDIIIISILLFNLRGVAVVLPFAFMMGVQIVSAIAVSTFRRDKIE